jgi:hypothetical protein
MWAQAGGLGVTKGLLTPRKGNPARGRGCTCPKFSLVGHFAAANICSAFIRGSDGLIDFPLV